MPTSIPISPKEEIRAKALSLGFDACGFAEAHEVALSAQEQYDEWISRGRHSCMLYAAKYPELRANPASLFPGAKTVICVALNYFPRRRQSPDKPQFAYYAYGADYHEVIRQRLTLLADFLQQHFDAKSRVCVDTAPMRERYWAQQAGIGMIGRNNSLIIPHRGSFFFLGELITSLAINPDEPCTLSCGNCNLCVAHCPTGALDADGALDANRCLSCQLIERRGEIPLDIASLTGNHVYGCDECQKCCPHNTYATPSDIEEFEPSNDFLNLTTDDIVNMDHDSFLRLFRHSAVRRAKLDGLVRNASIIARRSKK